jgi:hypothetical protein
MSRFDIIDIRYDFVGPVDNRYSFDDELDLRERSQNNRKYHKFNHKDKTPLNRFEILDFR